MRRAQHYAEYHIYAGGKVGPAGDAQICGARFYYVRLAVEYPDHTLREKQAYYEKQRGYKAYGDYGYAVCAAYTGSVLCAPILGYENCGSRTHSEGYHIQKPAELSCHPYGGKRKIPELPHHDGIYQNEGACKQVLHSHREGELQRNAPEAHIAKVFFKHTTSSKG